MLSGTPLIVPRKFEVVTPVFPVRLHPDPEIVVFVTLLMRPCASVVITGTCVADPYVPAVPTAGILIVPVEVIVPPDNPVPAVIEVTVPPELLSVPGAHDVPFHFKACPVVAPVVVPSGEPLMRATVGDG